MKLETLNSISKSVYSGDDAAAVKTLNSLPFEDLVEVREHLRLLTSLTRTVFKYRNMVEN
jgi:hypothetical protein